MSDALRDELVALTCDLVRIESVADRPDQLAAVIDYAAAYLADVPGLFVERSEAGGKPALVVALRDTRAPALMLNGHLDVVVGRPEQFAPEVRDGRIYGRGSQDMKGSCAVMLRLIRDLAALPERPDVGFQLVTDEEIGGAEGTGRLLAEGWRCGFMLCLEPTDMGVLFEHKGALWVELRLPGRPAHGSRPWDGHNPVGDLARGLAALDARFPIPDGPNSWQTTVTPTHVQTGAGSRNQVPPGASVTFDIRYTADTTPEAIQATLAECFPTAELVVGSCGPGLRTDPEHPEVCRVADLLAERLGRPPRFYREHFATDARYYTSAGIPAVCVGPVGAGLHSDEEWVAIDSLLDLHAVLTAYILSS
ncbi:MAG TPA: M20/M25/M40 family metallo-hydrolase [Chloroflexaceae bacterium]|nr:M20/M25/M40 family metallo-hydrolase [Chloroflexaceae bacterium]